MQPSEKWSSTYARSRLIAENDAYLKHGDAFRKAVYDLKGKGGWTSSDETEYEGIIDYLLVLTSDLQKAISGDSQHPLTPDVYNDLILRLATAHALMDQFLKRFAGRRGGLIKIAMTAGGGTLLPNGTLLGGGTGVPSLGGLGSIGGTGHGFGGFGGGGGPNGTDLHGIPGMGGFGKRPGDDDGGQLGAPSVHGSGFQGDFGNGFFGSGFLHAGVGFGGGLKGGGTAPSGGGISGKKTGSGTTGGSYVDSTSRNDARGSGSDRDRVGDGGGGVDKGGGGGGDTTSPREKAGMTEKASGEVDKSQEKATSTRPADNAVSKIYREVVIPHLVTEHAKKPKGGGESAPVDGSGGDTGGNASESRRTFTGYHPQNSGPAGAVTVGVGVRHLPGSPVSYITATSHVGSIGGTTEGFGGTNPNVRVYRPDPEASGGGGGPHGVSFMPSEETGSPRGPTARIARQVTVTSTGARTRLR